MELRIPIPLCQSPVKRGEILYTKSQHKAHSRSLIWVPFVRYQLTMSSHDPATGLLAHCYSLTHRPLYFKSHYTFSILTIIFSALDRTFTPPALL